jgi:hypothetical protein
MVHKEDSPSRPTHVLHNSGHSETSVTYVFAFTNFYGGFAVPTSALFWYKSGYGEINCKHNTVTYVFDLSCFYWCRKRRFEPLTHALRTRSSPLQAISIKILRTPNAIFGSRTRGEFAYAGTKVGTVICASQPHQSRRPYTNQAGGLWFEFLATAGIPYPCWLQRALVRFELARKNSQKPFSSNVPAASSRTACAAASSLAVNR